MFLIVRRHVMKISMVYKKASNRLWLLAKLSDQVTSEVAFKIYQMMIVPVLMYSGTIKPLLTRTQLNKLSSIDCRASEIIRSEINIPRFENLMKIKACLVVSVWITIYVVISVAVSRSITTIYTPEIILYYWSCQKLNLNSTDKRLDLLEQRFTTIFRWNKNESDFKIFQHLLENILVVKTIFKLICRSLFNWLYIVSFYW